MGTTSPVTFEVWSDDAAERARTGASGAGAAGGSGPGRPPLSAPSTTLLLAALTGAVLASAGFLGAAVVADVHDERQTAAVREQVSDAIVDLMRTRDLVLVRPPTAPVPVPAPDEHGPCSPVRAERLGHC